MESAKSMIQRFKERPAQEKFALVVWLALVIMGATQATNWSTDNYSDQFIFDEMKALLLGQHRYGIVGNTHYPNGPGYILLPFMAAGVSELRTLRWIPFCFSIIALSFFMLALVRSNLSRGAQWTVMILWSLLAFLPAFVYWQGALHEHSYAMSLSLASLAVAIWPQEAIGPQSSGKVSSRKPAFWLLMCSAIGYCAGWTGFDFLPVHLLSFFTVSAAAHGVFQNLMRSPLAGDSRFRTTSHLLKRPVLLSIATLVGALAAIFSHLVQNTLYFGSWRAAWNDLIGSATTYAGIQSAAQTMSPEYYQGIATSIAEKGKDTHVLSVLTGFTHSFATDWASPLWCAVFVLAFFLLPRLVKNRAQMPPVKYRIWLKHLAPGAVLSLAACYSWPALMPNHAVFHFHFLPRHFIVGLLALSLINGFAIDSSDAETSKA